MKLPTLQKIPTRYLQAGTLLVLAVALVALGARYLQGGVDWYAVFRPAGLAVLQGESPYSVPGFRNAPWAILPVLPFAWLPANTGRAAYLLLSLIAFAYAAYKLGAPPLTLIAFLLSPPVLHCLLNANNDWLPLLGFVLPPQIGLFFVVVKPQMGIAMVLYWLIETLREGGWRRTVQTFAPVTIVTLASFVLFGFWPERFLEPTTYIQNDSLWPASIPIGLALLAAAIKRRTPEYAMAASPCLSPYLILHSWSGALITLVRNPAEMLAAVGGLWLLILIRAFQIGVIAP
ncbi:MAG: hypothetical protein IT326_05320 [Anaerolineae bacterium]|nr:hypothetical protein [Anaerolineae bacterium]